MMSKHHKGPRGQYNLVRPFLKECRYTRLGIGRYGVRAAALARDLKKASAAEQIIRLERKLVRAVSDLEREVTLAK